MLKTITLNRDYGYSQFRYAHGDADIIDATNAWWIVANMGEATNRYPIIIEGGKTGLEIIGGTVLGEVPLTLDWTETYINSAAIELRGTFNATVRDWTITQCWDGVRIKEGSEAFIIEGVQVITARDDAVENDYALSGTIRNCLFDGVFSGISLGIQGMPDRSNEVVTIDNVLIRMESYLYKGEVTHQSPLKMESGSPALRITNSVFAIEDVSHGGLRRLALAWDKTVESSGNVFLNLSDTPLPSDYPRPPSGWTVLQGEAARDYWEAASADWIAAQGGETETDGDGVLVGTADDETLTGADGNGVLYGLDGNDTLLGRGGNDTLRGMTGNDTLNGGLGVDRLEGGAGNDIYILAARGDTVVEGLRTGTDLVRAGYSTTLGANVENLILTGASTLNGAGNALANRLTGNAAANTLSGLAGNDILSGGGGNDVLRGGAGRDKLIGGAGSDDFVFLATSHSAPAAATRDIITGGFERGLDDIVVSAIDARAGLAGNQAFSLDTNGSFSQGEIRQTVISGGLLVEFNTDSDATAEMAILIQGLTAKLAGTDFMM